MGIPGFVRWLRENMDIFESVGSYMKCDNLYLDLNGIIHVCSHNNEPGKNVKEKHIFSQVEKMIKKIISIANPQKRLYLSVDGVAPRAKMNQQRTRRYESRKKNELLHQQMVESLEQWKTLNLPCPEKVNESWDSNQITPGTKFMERMNNFLHRIGPGLSGTCSTEENSVKVVISDSTIHGEGEHKIMDLIRKSDSKESHVVFGNDSDLYLLCALSPASDISILREKSNGKGNTKGYNVANIDKFRKATYKLLGGKDEDRSDVKQYLHDFIFLSNLFGNDFLPSLLSLQLHNNHRGIEDVVGAYCSCKNADPEFCITNELKVNREAFLTILKKLQQQEESQISSHYKFHNLKESNSHGRNNRHNGRSHDRKKYKDKVNVENKQKDTVSVEKKDDSLVHVVKEAEIKQNSNSTEVTESDISTSRSTSTRSSLSVSAIPFIPEEKKTSSERIIDGESFIEKSPLTEQIEYYFSARNLSRDKYLYSILKANENTVPLFAFMDFPKVILHTTEINVLQDAINESAVLELTNDGQAAKRKDGMRVQDLREKPRGLSYYNFQNRIDYLVRSMEGLGRNKSKYRVDLSCENWVSNYHNEYTKFGENKEQKSKLVYDYIEGMVWVLDYYINGVNNWTWFFGSHYPPLLLDLVQCMPENLSCITIHKTQPVPASIQLLSVLPPSSGACHLPKCFHEIYKDLRIKKYYPENYDVDFSGCLRAFQAKVCLPFIPSEILFEVWGELDHRKEEESRRDNEGVEMEYTCQFVSRVFYPNHEKSSERKKKILLFGTAIVVAGILYLKVLRN